MKSRTNHIALRRIALAVGTLSVLWFVGGDDTAQCVSGWEWSYNSKGQSPCDIAGLLQASCLGYADYVIPPLPAGGNYITPQPNDTNKNCSCNTVVYSLFDACTLCQFNTSVAGLTWGFWDQYCDNGGVAVGWYPPGIPFNVSVPHWAFLNDTDPGFNPTLAQAAGRDPESTKASPNTITQPSSSSSSLHQSTDQHQSTPSVSRSSNPVATANGGGGSKSHTGAIAGGVVGGVIGISCIAALTLFLKKRKAGDTNDTLNQYQMEHNPAQDQKLHEPLKVYNPADPSTFPSPLSGGNSSNSGVHTTNAHPVGRYTGAPEL